MPLLIVLLASVVFGLAMILSILFGRYIGESIAARKIEAHRRAAAEYQRQAEAIKNELEELRAWAEATIQNVADAAAEHGLELRLNAVPVAPRRPDLKEWPDLIGEK